MSKASGFTVLEMIFAFGIFALLSLALIALSSTYIAYSSLLPGGKLSNDVSRAHQGTLEDIKRSIRQAENILQSYIAGSDMYVTGTTTLALRLYARDSTGNVNSNAFDYLIYYLSTTTSPWELRRRVIPDAASSRKASNFPINPYVQDILFSYNDETIFLATKVNISLTSQKTSGNITKQFTNLIDATLR